MKKPKSKKVERLDYHQCEDFIEKKLGCKLRDTLGKFSPEALKDGSYKTKEYRDFWHFIVSEADVHNGSELFLDKESFKARAKSWQLVILEEFWREFGEGPYWVEW